MVDMSKVKVTNIMADGSICEDLSTYLETHTLPDDVLRMILGFIRDGRAIRQRDQAVSCMKTTIMIPQMARFYKGGMKNG